MKGRTPLVERHGQAVGAGAADRVVELVGHKLDELRVQLASTGAQLVLMLGAVLALAAVALLGFLIGSAS